jgi:hypothetical protein
LSVLAIADQTGTLPHQHWRCTETDRAPPQSRTTPLTADDSIRVQEKYSAEVTNYQSDLTQKLTVSDLCLYV